MNIYLDDLRTAPAGFTLVRNIDECLLLMDEVKVEKLSLDYHLAAGRTADEVCVWMVRTGHWPRDIFLHSSDLPARTRMYQYLQSHAPSDVRVHQGPYKD